MDFANKMAKGFSVGILGSKTLHHVRFKPLKIAFLAISEKPSSSNIDVPEPKPI